MLIAMKSFFRVSVLLFVLFGCKSASFLDSASKEIESSIARNRRQIFVSDYQIRKILIRQGYLSFVDEKDTLYLLGDHDLPSETYYGSIWTNKKMFNYSYQKDKVEEKSSPPFREKMIKLISLWDTTSIRKESNINYNLLNPSRVVTAYRVYTLNTKIKVDRIDFRPFE